MSVEHRLKEIHEEIKSNIQTMESASNDDVTMLLDNCRLLIREFNQLFEIFIGGAK